ncbi:DUF1275 domain-containing protein, partial [Streptococcus agalactiae]|nr:DUF1275 domain-containing protein [Streptococcus agalactiae]MCC9963331.1 DUF1275 domain-containing protein [Streptococcus agalactiae]
LIPLLYVNLLLGHEFYNLQVERHS